MGRKTVFIDWVIIVPLTILAILGLTVLVSSTSSLVVPQLLFIGIGLGVFFLFSKVDYQILEYFWVPLYAVSLLLLAVTFLGPQVRGVTRWLDIGFVRLQPSELVKPLLLISFAAFFSKNNLEKISFLATGIILFVPPAFLLFLQPDLGNVLVYCAFFVGLLIIAGIPTRAIVVLFIIASVAIPVSFPFLKEYQKLRIVSFLKPANDIQGNGYNAFQSMIAVGSGGVLGRGFGRGVQSRLRFLPENHTDFIFASFVEEFGLAGGSVLLMVEFFLLWQITRIVQDNNASSFVRLFSAGCFLQLSFQILVNVGMNMGVVPITGITLPFVSYGGSSFVATCMELGIIASMRNVPSEAGLAIH